MPLSSVFPVAAICAMHKEELRREIRRLKQQYTPAQLEQLSQPVIARLRPHLDAAQVILAYYSLSDEVCTHQLIDELIAEGKTVLLPRVIDCEHMELRRYTGSHDLVEGAYGIMEPVGEPFTDYALIDIALIPGMAFDAAGHRLGRGKGYYDRFLSQLSTVNCQLSTLNCQLSTVNSQLLPPRFFGLCFDFQKVDAVPSDDHDVRIDIVI